VLCRHVVEALRRLRPDIVVTVDPWLPHEAHLDHTRTGRAVAQALLLRGFPRYPTAPEIDAAWRADPGPAVQGLVLYFTREPNLVFDIERARERKHRAIDCYRSQLQGDELRGLHAGLGALERRWAADHSFSHGEALRWLSPAELHVGIA